MIDKVRTESLSRMPRKIKIKKIRAPASTRVRTVPPSTTTPTFHFAAVVAADVIVCVVEWGYEWW
jgi:hypothetical protein